MSVYEDVTNRFLEEIKNGVCPWRKPWSIGTGTDWAYSHVTGKPYSYLNTLLCGCGEFLTFPTAKKEGGFIKKGAKSRTILAPSAFIPKEEKDKPEDEQEAVFYFRRINVFHISDAEKIEAKVEKPPKLFPDSKPIEAAEKVIADYLKRSGVRVVMEETNNKAAYSSAADLVKIPIKERFEDINEYYATFFHELAHSTGYATRLNRDFGKKKGSKKYSNEELVAEFATTIVMRKIGLETPKTWQNSCAYLDGWAKEFNADKKMILTSASKAEKAANLILGLDEEK